MSRKISDLVPEMQTRFLAFSAKMAESQIPFVLTCTRRTQEQQDALYEHGRTKPGPVVTWTRRSRHIAGTAFDIAIVRDGKATWDIKVNVNNNEIPDYEEAGKIGERCGLEWGGRWGTPDRPHFQLKDNA